MTIRTRIVLGVSAAALSLGLALSPAAFAQDKMGKDDGMMKKDTMSKDGMKKDTMSKDDGMKKDHMSKDGMKKDDGMMKKNWSSAVVAASAKADARLEVRGRSHGPPPAMFQFNFTWTRRELNVTCERYFRLAFRAA